MSPRKLLQRGKHQWKSCWNPEIHFGIISHDKSRHFRLVVAAEMVVGGPHKTSQQHPLKTTLSRLFLGKSRSVSFAQWVFPMQWEWADCMTTHF